ncbi:hypothetical protein CFC21_048980 [Triticum aestivum]|uniref:Uncharacterized protein n=2 Tax=Triticum aestivum TaxID=4565 RepID=A0A3B6N0D1_WHEAT|nr:uncharacterized protein LOC123125945 [Triticum aestivum]KAF7038883.1 hypothetical protein CFC21_048980 [Triticum aestivum]
MDSPQKKLGSTMDGEMPHLLPVTVSETVSNSKETRAAPPPDAVVIVSEWAFYPGFIAFLFYTLHYAITSALSLFFLLTGAEAEAAKVSVLHVGMLCFAALQVAAAAVALRLPRRRGWVRYAFAYLALALAIVGHCMFAAGDHFFRILRTVGIFIYAAGDVLCFLALLLDLLGLLGGEK